MTPTLFEQINDTLKTQGPERAIDSLCQQLRESKQYHALFYALLLKKRYELGVSPIPTGPAEELPSAVHEPYEEGIKLAARQVGNLLLADQQIPQAWGFFRMIGEPGPIREALEVLQPSDNDDVQSLVQIAFYEGVHPTKGFDWILNRFGLCNAITTLGGGETPHPNEVKQYCIRALVRALYSELRHRLTAEIQQRFSFAPSLASSAENTPGVLRKLVNENPWLFEEDSYHIDTSHLSSVVQMSMLLEPCAELEMAQELCAYGAHLSGRFLSQEETPFDQGYRDYEIYLSVLSGTNVDAGLAHFRSKVEQADLDEVGTYPAEVLVNLLLRVDRSDEALAVARKYLAKAESQGRQLTCPNLNELCQRLKSYQTLAEVAKELNDPVYYLAGLLADRQKAKQGA